MRAECQVLTAFFIKDPLSTENLAVPLKTPQACAATEEVLLYAARVRRHAQEQSPPSAQNAVRAERQLLIANCFSWNLFSCRTYY